MMFESILGNVENKKLLENSIKTGKISHSYIFIGKSRNWKIYNGKGICKSNTLLKR